MNWWQQLLITMVVALVPAIAAYLLGRRKAKVEPDKIRAETMKLVTDAAGGLVEDLRQECNRLGTQLDKLRGDVATAAQVTIKLRDTATSQDSELQQHTADLKQLHADLEAAKDRIIELQAENVILGKRVATLKLENQALRVENQDLRDIVEELSRGRCDGDH